MLPPSPDSGGRRALEMLADVLAAEKKVTAPLNHLLARGYI
jgi:hypothetical protein